MSEPKRGRSVIVEFRETLPYRLVSVLALIGDAPNYEGFDPQLYAAHAALPSGLRRDIELIYQKFGHSLLITKLCEETPEFDDFTAFIGWLTQTPATEIERAIVASLQDLEGAVCPCEPTGVPGLDVPPLEDEAALRKFLREVADPWAERIRGDEAVLEQMVRLLRDPVEFKARLVLVLTQFWDAQGSCLDEVCVPIIGRSLKYHRQREYTGTATEVYLQVAGKRPSSEGTFQKFERASRVLFVPSCHSGAYATITCPIDDEETLVVVFNCRSASGGDAGEPEILGRVFPTLRALADETRLQIVHLLRDRELYAQQIVDQLDISQSTVSRHLSLLVAGGVLSVRRGNGMKFYRLNESSLERFLGDLRAMIGEGGSD